jgi:thiamine-phosphate pyrophosphorylase
MKLPRLYVIVDAEVLRARGVELRSFAQELRVAGVRLVQYRDKVGSPQELLRHAELLREVFKDSGATILLNDRADLAVLAGCDGVHVGQEDLSPADARHVIGPDRVVGVSTHNDDQVRVAAASVADYVAIGPVFATGTKANPDPVVGLEGVRRARALTNKPLVAIGGITRANARSVIEAGADSVAVISGLFSPGETVAQVVRDFLVILG